MNANKFAVFFLVLMMVAAVAVIVVGMVNNHPISQPETIVPTVAAASPTAVQAAVTIPTVSPTAVPATRSYPTGTPAWFIRLPWPVQIILGILVAAIVLVGSFLYLRDWFVIIWTALNIWYLGGPLLTVLLVELIFQKSIAGFSGLGKTLVLAGSVLGGLVLGLVFKFFRETVQFQKKMDRHFELIHNHSVEYIRCPNCDNPIGLLGSSYGMDNISYKYINGKDVPVCPRCGQVLRLPEGY